MIFDQLINIPFINDQLNNLNKLNQRDHCQGESHGVASRGTL